MSISTGFELPRGPATGTWGGATRVLVAIGCEADAEPALRELDMLGASCSCSVTLLGVVAPSLFVRSFGPLSGITTCEGILEHHIDAAGQLARAIAATARTLSVAHPPNVDHLRAASSWTGSGVLEPLRLGVYDALIVGRLPRGRRAWRRLLAAARASETEVIVGSTRERSLRP
jgi:hypothetical protein